MINKNIKKFICLTLNLFFISIIACSISKNVTTKKTELFKEEILKIESISKIQIKFLRPSLYINFIVANDLKKEDVKKLWRSYRRL